MAKTRSPNYPQVSLPKALADAKLIFDSDERTALPIEQMCVALGYKSASGPARTRVAGLRKYGLVESAGNGLRISDRAIKALTYPAGSKERAQAIVEAGLAPALFRELRKTHGSASDSTLTAHLVAEKCFSQAGAKACVKAFRETFRLEELRDVGYSNSDSNKDVDGQVNKTESDSVPAFSTPPVPPSDQVSESATYRLSPDCSVSLAFRGVVTQQCIQKLEKYLETAKDAYPDQECADAEREYQGRDRRLDQLDDELGELRAQREESDTD